MCQEHSFEIRTEVREYKYTGILNFRDLGGYKVPGGKITAWRRLFRSGELRHMTSRDLFMLKYDVRPSAVIDLRESHQTDVYGVGRVGELGARYYPMPLYVGNNDETGYAARDEEFLALIDIEDSVRGIIGVLELLADPQNLPAIIHCSAGRTRTGITTAIILGTLGVSDEDIVADFMLSAPSLLQMKERMVADPALAEKMKQFPDYVWHMVPDSMETFLKTIRERFGSMRGFLAARGADESLFERLNESLLSNPPGPTDYTE